MQYVAEVKKPDGERLPQYHEAGLDSLRFQMLSPAPVYPAVEKMFMKTCAEPGERKTRRDDAYLQAIMQGGDIDKTVDALVDGTKLGDPGVPEEPASMEAKSAVAASTDPMIVAARRADPVWRANYVNICATKSTACSSGRREAG